MAEPPIQMSLPDPSDDIDLPAAWEARRLRPLLRWSGGRLAGNVLPRLGGGGKPDPRGAGA